MFTASRKHSHVAIFTATVAVNLSGTPRTNEGFGWGK